MSPPHMLFHFLPLVPALGRVGVHRPGPELCGTLGSSLGGMLGSNKSFVGLPVKSVLFSLVIYVAHWDRSRVFKYLSFHGSSSLMLSRSPGVTLCSWLVEE